MNIQHSSRSDERYTPEHILELVRKVLGDIDFDPASSDANPTDAKRWLTREDDALSTNWPAVDSIYLNPPGGKRGNRSMLELFWGRLMKAPFGHCIFAMFSLNGLQTTQRHTPNALDFPFCVPRKRVKWVSPLDESKTQPSHSNAFVYVPGGIDKTQLFKDTFSSLGTVVIP